MTRSDGRGAAAARSRGARLLAGLVGAVTVVGLLPAPADAQEVPGVRPPSSHRLAAVSAGAPLSSFYSAVGRLDLSVDGLGMRGSAGTVEVQKGARATVRAAFLMAASTGFSGYAPRDGDVTLAGQPVRWEPTRTISNSIASVNVLADVTDIVKPLVDGAPEGRVPLQVTEGPTGSIDGEVLAVVLDDPDVPKTGTVSLLYGAQDVAGDRIRVLQPLDTADPDLALRMSLGISFGFQPSGQYSLVSVNGRRLSSSAGGQDDGEPANGALLTVGGLGDRLDNPDPTASDHCGLGDRCDDEAYDLKPFVADGDTTIDIATQNPSRDDNLFFAGFQLNAVQAVVGEGVLLTPGAQDARLGDPVRLEALVQDSDGNPLADRPVRLRVVRGPNAGATREDRTGRDGTVSFGYASATAGRDELVADYVDGTGVRRTSNTASVAWATGPARWSGPFPLVGAHGITGKAEDMNTALQAAQATVPGLRQPGRTSSAPTSSIGSVWNNAVELVDHTRQVLRSTGAPAVNVVAHSKGGLDTRVAMWFRPDLFSSLGMLATPNGGSKGANKLCALRRLGIDSALREQGPCDDDSDGLYNLQTSYVDDVINVEVRDYRDRGYYVAAGNCSTRRTTFRCNGAANAILDCDEGGDLAVCVESAFRRTYQRSDGTHVALGPVFQDVDHSAMNREPCPITRVLAELYPVSSRGNSWLEDGGATCDRLPSTRTSSLRASSAEPVEDVPALQADVDQQLRAVPAGPAAPLRAVLDPEGGDAVVAEVYLPAGATATVTVRDAAGRVDERATVDELAPEARFGEQVVLVTARGLAGATRTLEVTPSQQGVLGLATSLPSGAPALVVEAEPAGTGRARITAALEDAAAGSTSRSTATASWPTGSGTRTVALPRDPRSGRFAAEVEVPTGRHVPVVVSLAGPLTRTGSTGVVLPDGSGRLLGLAGDRLVDTDDDGSADVLRVDVAVAVDRAGTYNLAVDLLGPDGQPVTSAPGRAALAAGEGTVPVDVPVDALRGSGSGPWRLVQAVLSRGEATRTRVAEAAALGSTGVHALPDLAAADQPVLTRPAATALDLEQDGRFDVLRWTSSASVPTPGAYRLQGVLRSPDGRATETVDRELQLSGTGPVTVDLPGASVGAAAAGPWSLAGLSLTRVDDASVSGSAPTGLSAPLDPRLWAGRTVQAADLLALWDEAVAAGAVSPDGTGVSERQRLTRVVEAARTGDAATATSELDRFLSHLRTRSTRVAAPWDRHLVSYAQDLRTALGG